MERSELITILSVFFAALAALYARWCSTHARKANEIAVQAELKPRRLSLYASMKDFLHFCSTYKTMQSLQMVQGTQDLSARTDAFKWEVKQHGPLDIPEIETLAKDARTKAAQLQRLLDRSSGPDAKPIEPGYKTAEDNIDAIIEWFASREKELETLFEPYLRITQQ